MHTYASDPESCLRFSTLAGFSFGAFFSTCERVFVIIQTQNQLNANSIWHTSKTAKNMRTHKPFSSWLLLPHHHRHRLISHFPCVSFQASSDRPLRLLRHLMNLDLNHILPLQICGVFESVVQGSKRLINIIYISFTSCELNISCTIMETTYDDDS